MMWNYPTERIAYTIIYIFFTIIFQTKVMSELINNGVQIYQFPTNDETISEANGNMNSQLPFAVVGSNDFVKVGNKMVRARQYPWGVVQGIYICSRCIAL